MDLIKAEIDISALRHNFRQVRKLAGRDTLVCAVIKDNAYGHGLLPVAAVMADEGADSLAVADLSDAEKLRSAGFKLPILNISGILPCQAADAVKLHVSQTVSTFAGLLALEKAAKKQNKCALVHIEVDCGMGRLGVPAREFSPLFERRKALRIYSLKAFLPIFPPRIPVYRRQKNRPDSSGKQSGNARPISSIIPQIQRRLSIAAKQEWIWSVPALCFTGFIRRERRKK